MHRYSVVYIERDGHVAKRHVFAKDRHEAKRIAEKDGCEDIIKVKHDGISGTLWTIALISLAVVLGVVAYRYGFFK